MHRINDAVIRDGKLVLADLPFAEGQHVQVTVAEQQAEPAKAASIEAVRAVLRGAVEHYDDPFEPVIAADEWEMLK